MFMKTFLHILKRFLNEKYPVINFEFYPSRRSKNVHMELNCSILKLHEQNRVIPDIEGLWLLKRQDTKFKFVMSQLIRATKWKFDYITFRRNADF